MGTLILFVGTVVLGVIGSIFSLYFKNIVLFEGLIFAVASYIVAVKVLLWHPVFALLTAAALLLIVMGVVLKTRIGLHEYHNNSKDKHRPIS